MFTVPKHVFCRSIVRDADDVVDSWTLDVSDVFPKMQRSWKLASLNVTLIVKC